MLDLGWPELLVIIAVAVMVIGPREIPQIMYNLGKVVRRLHYMKFALSQQFEDFMNEAEIEAIRKEAQMRPLDELQDSAEDEERMAEAQREGDD